MIWILDITVLALFPTVLLITLCDCKRRGDSGFPTSSKKQLNASADKVSPQVVKPPDSLLNASVTPDAESPPLTAHSAPMGPPIEPPTPLDNGVPHKGSSPQGGNNTGTGEGTTPGTGHTPGTGTGTAQSTPQSSTKKREQSSKRAVNPVADKNSVCSNESQDLLIETMTEGPDSLMEKGTTKTKEPNSNYQPQPSRRKRIGAKKKRSLEKEFTAKTMQSPAKKTELEKAKVKNEPVTSSGSGNMDKEQDYDDLKEITSKDPTDEREKKKDVKEEKKSVVGKASIIPTITPLDSTQCSQTRKEPK